MQTICTSLQTDNHTNTSSQKLENKLPSIKYQGQLVDDYCEATTMKSYDQLLHPFNGRFSGTTQVSRYQKRKTNLDFTEARDSEWQ